jgi:hypothetical protein
VKSLQNQSGLQRAVSEVVVELIAMSVTLVYQLRAVHPSGDGTLLQLAGIKP